MKSALELAMERSSGAIAGKTVTPEMKENIANINRTYDAKIAEKEIMLATDPEGPTLIAKEKARLNEKREREIEAIREG